MSPLLTSYSMVKVQSFSFKIRNKTQEGRLTTCLLQHSAGSPSQSNLGKRKKSKNIQNLKEEKLALFLGDIILHIDNLKDFIKNY